MSDILAVICFVSLCLDAYILVGSEISIARDDEGRRWTWYTVFWPFVVIEMVILAIAVVLAALMEWLGERIGGNK